METKNNSLVEATQINIEKTIERIKAYATEKGYQYKGAIHIPEVKFSSLKQSKVCRNYLTRIDRKIGMSVCNRFLHFLYKKVCKLDNAPYIEYSEKELKIKQSRKAWKKVQKEAELLLATYKAEKGDFYKQK